VCVCVCVCVWYRSGMVHIDLLSEARLC